ncbi:hypothetical protein [Micromonospora echinofusca]|uniref:Uncharacterized protein n=1 Tax=Micromonospora echinofusca TaxID=47858 RepID=A0ABS3VZK0_MICEH|nr:hypothetical protein [Micromonospora echinofusca]MBO4209948.1 hypothetical protein [Micromonospora echinofusca]
MEAYRRGTLRLRDPRQLTVEPEDTVPPPVLRHWPHHSDVAYDIAVNDLARRLRQVPAHRRTPGRE